MSGIDPRRPVPRTDTVLADPRLLQARDRLGAGIVKRAVHDAQARVRRGDLIPDAVADAALAGLPDIACTLRPILNATGVLLHTNLGRAPLSSAALDAIVGAGGYVDVEYDLARGRRSSRGRAAVDALLASVPAAADALVLNNGAAALVLAATALSDGREIIVGRGELVEIGDKFRIPDLLVSTGAQLREVGSTNRTHLSDYRDAVGPRTGFILKVHPSNFALIGFTATVPVHDLTGLGVPVVADIGSGLLTPEPALPDEPDAQTWLASGADLITASGDKLLGGPQAGLVLGRADLVHTMRRHPLARALRTDKLTLAGLEATLIGPPTPTWQVLHADPDQLRARTDVLATLLASHGLIVHVVPCDGVVGGGGAPGQTLPGWAIQLPASFASPLRTGRPAVVARVEHGQCLLDLRCVPASADPRLADAVLAAATAITAFAATTQRSGSDRVGDG